MDVKTFFKKYFFALLMLLSFVVIVCSFDVAMAAGADSEAGGGGYLSGYSEVDPRPSAMSWWSTLAYLLSLLAVFAFVVVMAYFVSRFLSGRFAQISGGEGGRVLSHVPLGPNRSVCIIELGEHVFMLGVTDHQITLLSEVTDAAEIERLKSRSTSNLGSTGAILSSQIGSLEALARRIPSLFKGEKGNQ